MSSSSFASIEGEIQTEMFKYASESSPSFYFSSRTTFQTSSFLAHIRGYYESGARGTWMFNPNPFRYTLTLNDMGDQLWFGREHPLALTRPTRVDPYGALGHIWAQNQLEALDPTSEGWIGLGGTKAIDQNFKFALAYSPLFIPTFGPSLGISDRGELNPARYARLPPSQIRTGDATVPIRYQIKLGQLSELLLQHQFFTGITYQDESRYADLYFFTAPQPDPEALTNGTFQVQAASNSLNANVEVTPQFPRKYWVGTQYQFKDIFLFPTFELVGNLQDFNQRFASITGYTKLSNRVRASMGLLTHLGQKSDAPTRADWLMFVRFPIKLSDEMEFRTAIETTLQSMRQSFYWLNQIEYQLSKSLSTLGEIRLLSGQDNSFYGDWRAYDSYSWGLKWVW